MAKPRQVQKAVEAAEEAHRSVYTQQGEPSADEETENQDTDENVQTDGDDAGSADEQFGDGSENQDLGAAPVEDDTWKRKYEALQGKYDAEVPRLQRENTQLNERLARLEGMLANVGTQRHDDDAPPKREKASSDTSFITAEDVENYGSEFLDVMERKAREVASREINKLNERIRRLESSVGQVSTTVQQTSAEALQARLDREAPEWRELNADPGFLDWLDQTDPFSGSSRREMLAGAYKAGDASRTAAFFKAYQKEKAAVDELAHPPATQTAPPRQERGAGAKRDRMNTMVEPGSSRTGTADAPSETKTWTRGDISKFYGDVRKGVYRNDPEKQQRIEQDIINATQEGRVVAG